MKETLLQGLWTCAKFLFYAALWQFVLFHLGSLALRAVTLGRYSKRRTESHPDGTAFVGMLVLLTAWAAITFYNHLHPIGAPVASALHG